MPGKLLVDTCFALRSSTAVRRAEQVPLGGYQVLFPHFSIRTPMRTLAPLSTVVSLYLDIAASKSIHMVLFKFMEQSSPAQL